MGRSEELSDFQRGIVVGCHLSKKSVRDISSLLSLPRSTVSSVILKWKRGGITTAMPRSGRPHKLQEQHRRVLETVAQEKSFPSVNALTSEFQSASGTSVSSRTVLRELREMGFRGRVSKYKSKVEEQLEKRQGTLSREDVGVDASPLDLRVGQITALRPLETDSLYVAQVDVGETTHRTVVSELVNRPPADQMQNHMAVLLCNLTPTNIGGVDSQDMVMCASSPDGVEILDPPSGAVAGDRVTVQGFQGEPDKELTPTEFWDKVQVQFTRELPLKSSARECANPKP